ncbi:heat-inducible transcriptional repressor HrcA [Lysinibacillus sp. BW-2-10]|uniref:heat-inducible transcriptional repressor HrcA n=1 Tax=Lysinibacillus sp. BW-2-10 TaxID=2590030 RepID=UPI00117C716B|nr:heat-inducible transcriptional repressor HrcA [Lysinibacillus sp. BW-2-10]TSI03307.1 heat-inducible transcriptional repressor HrcA [Lysinibacillus sp. BW-2-10]
MLTNRQLQILQVIVDDFVISAQPVGSRQISKKDSITFSPATIRNEMADLEELGYLEKTHTSSGRIPSEKGYRFYVDHLLQPKTMSLKDVGLIQSIFQNQIVEMEQVIRESASILSDLTSYTTILLGPNVGKHRIKRFQIVPLTAQTAVAIIVTDNGHVENRTFTLPDGFDPSDIEKTVNILNERLIGVPLLELQSKLELEAFNVLRQHVHTADSILQSLKNVTSVQNEGKIYFGGKTNMLNQPEFHDLNKVRALLELMEKESQVIALFQPSDTGIHIRIGSENNHLAMEDLSVITATYAIGKEQEGSIAIIGPTRMDYQRVISLLDIMSSGLTRVLSNKQNGGL